MKGFKRIISIFLSVLMLLSAMPITALADDERTDMSGSYNSYVWNYTAQTDTLYINRNGRGSLEGYDDPHTAKTEHYLPTVYSDNSGEHFWNGTFSKLVIGRNITKLNNVYLGYDVDERFYTYPELCEVEFEWYSNVASIGAYTFYKSAIAHIELPSALTYIGGFAFSESYLEDIVIPSKVTTISAKAFEGCKMLESAVVNAQITAGNDSIFANCTKLSNVVLGNNVEVIGTNTFRKCTSLKEIQLPEGLRTIGSGAFCESGIESIEIPGSVNTIYEKTFYNSELSSITFNEGLTRIWNNAFNGTKLTEVILPSSTVTVNNSAFANCRELTTVVMPSVKKIESGVFNKCSKLQSLSAPMVATVDTFGLSETSSLGSVYMPKLRAVNDKGFYGSGIESIEFASPEDSNVTANIGEAAFMTCTNLASVKLPTDLSVVSSGAFRACSRLKWIVIPQYTNTICSNAFINTPLVVITILNNNCNINTNALNSSVSLSIKGFEGSTAQVFAEANSNYTFVPIDENDDVFADGVYQPTAEEIQANKLKGTWSNGKWEISHRYLYITGEGEMTDNIAIDYNGDAMTFGELCNENRVLKIYIEKNITSIADYFLYTENGCCAYAVYIPNSLEKIGAYAFAGSSLEALYPNQRIFDFMSMSNSFVYFTNNVKEIGEYAFANCTELNATVMLPYDITAVKEGTFFNTPIKSVEMYGFVNSIEKKAFANCNNLKTLYIPCSAALYVDNENPENNSFGYGENGLISGITVYCREDSDAYRYAQANSMTTSINRGLAYATGKITVDGKKFLWHYYPEDKSLTITKNTDTVGSANPSKLSADNAEEAAVIEENTLMRTLIETGSMNTSYINYNYGSMPVDTVIVSEGITEFSCSDLLGAFNPKHVVFPESLTAIKYHTFRGCERLETVYIPMGVTSIEENAFADCPELVGVNLGGITKIDNSMFENKKKLRIVHMNNVEEIGDNAFSRCVELEEISIPDTTVSIGSKAFYKCIKAQEIRLGSGITTVGKNAFDDLAYCQRIIINSNLTADTAGEGFKDIGTSTTGVEIVYGDNVSVADFAVLENTRVTDIRLGRNISTISNKQNLPYAKVVTVDNANSRYKVLNNILYSKNGEVLVYSPARNSDITIAQGTLSIDEYAFYGTNAVSVVVPSSVTAMGRYAFANSKTLKNVDIERGLQEISTGAFEGCTALRSFYSPSSVRVIRDNAFKDCTRLSSVILPNRLTSIGAQAFMGCVSLVGMVVGEYVASIGDRAYQDCFALEEIYIWYDTVIGENAFDNDDNLTIFTMAGSDAYRYARENGIAYSAYTDEDSFYDLCGDKLDVYAGYLGYCTDGHGEIEWLTVYNADCENDGYIIGVCEYCSEIIDEKHIDAYGHDYKLTTRISATATTRGMKVYTCINCGEANCEYIESSGEEAEFETHTVTARVVLALDKNAESGKSPARNVSVVINDMVVAKTDSDGRFSLELETGTYEAQLVYVYGISRTIYIVVEDEDLDGGDIAIIGCDFNKDGKIDNNDLALSRMVISSCANDLSYLDYVDMNNDGYINAKDMAYILSCKGIDSKTYTYSEIVIRK